MKILALVLSFFFGYAALAQSPGGTQTPVVQGYWTTVGCPPSNSVCWVQEGSGETGAVAVQATPSASSHAAGVSVGGLFTFQIARSKGGTGGITFVGVRSAGGYTGGYYLYLWEKSPSSTCTDNTAFSYNAADAVYAIAEPFLLTPAVGATNDTASYAQNFGFYWSFVNQDTAPTANIYGCLVAAATDTADESAVVTWTVSGVAP